MYFDTHAHLDDKQFDEDRAEVIEKIRSAGVSFLVNIGADMESSVRSVELSQKYDFIYAAVGVHPYDAEKMTKEEFSALEELAKNEKVVAIGEIGLDYHYEEADQEAQKEWFYKQIKLAEKLDLPYIVHDRDAHGDCLDIIKKSGYYKGVMHCYSGSVEMAKELIKLGFYLSFAGPVTFKNGKKTKEVAEYAPLDKILIETDCPYLSPEPYRGRRNDSSMVPYIAATIAELKGVSQEELAHITEENGKRFFSIR